jgi:hypothetical protein
VAAVEPWRQLPGQQRRHFLALMENGQVRLLCGLLKLALLAEPARQQQVLPLLR